MSDFSIKAYDGTNGYIFVSYAHKDAARVLPIVDYLISRGYNLWYDEGIIPGLDWDEYLAAKVSQCSCFMLFVSERSMGSRECLKEIVRARESGRPLLSIFLESAAIPEEVADYVLKVQGIERWRMPSETDFYVKLLSSPLLDECKDIEEFQIREDQLVKYNGATSVVAIPDSVRHIGYDTFEGNEQVREIRIHGSVDRIGKFAFYNMRHLALFRVSEANRFYLADEGVLYNRAHNYLLRYPPARSDTEFTVPDGVINVAIGSFSGAEDLKQVTVSRDVKMIGDRAFESCRELVGVDLKAHLAKLHPYTFSRCAELTGIDLPPTLEEISDGAFSGCTSLLEVEFPESLRVIGEMAFAYCSSLKAIAIPAGVESIAEYCFNECPSLVRANLSSVRVIEQYAFKNCQRLEEVVFSEELRLIGRAAFSGCASLENLELPDSLESIESYGFDRCTNLVSVHCGKGIRRIGEGAFADDDALRTVFVPRSIEYIAESAIPDGAEIVFYAG